MTSINFPKDKDKDGKLFLGNVFRIFSSIQDNMFIHSHTYRHT